MWRVVIDTSALVSYLLTRGEIMGRVIAAWHSGEFVLLSSPATRAELAAVLARPRIAKRAALPLAPFANGYNLLTELVPGKLELPGACRDPKDDKFLACAVEGRAQYLISGDRDLLDVRRYQALCILNPGQFLVALHLAGLSPEQMQTRYSPAALAAIRSRMRLDPDTARLVEQVLSG